MAKKETFFERLLKKNAEQEGKLETKPKKRKGWKIITITAVLGATIVAGVSIPLAINATKINYIDPYKDSTLVYEFKSSIDSDLTIKFTIGDINKNDLNTQAKDPQKQLEQLNKIATYYLYEQEVKASKEYQRLWNQSLRENEKTDNTIALKTIAELQTQYKNEILDVEKNYKTKFGYANWETQFNQYLISNFNGAKTIDEAVEYQVFNKIKDDANRRFKLVNKDIKDLVERTANQTIYKVNEKGESLTNEAPLFEKGQKVFPWFSEEGKNRYFDVDGKYMSFMTDSFILEDKYKSADFFIDEFLKKDNPYLISQFTLPTVAPSKTDGDWAVDREVFKRLMYYWPAQEDNTVALKSYEMVQKYFKSFDEYVKVVTAEKSSNIPAEAIQYSTVLTQLSMDSADIKNNWGTSGMTTLNSLVASSSTMLEGLAILNDLIYPQSSSIPEVDLYGKLEEIRQSFGIAEPQQSADKTKEENQKEISKYNEAISALFDKSSESKKEGLYSDKYKSDVIDKMKELFLTNSEKGQISTLYKVKGQENQYIILTSTGIKIMIIKSLDNFGSDNKATLLEMMKNDYILSSKYDNLSGIKYNVSSLLSSSLTNLNYINDVMLSDVSFVNYLKQQDNIYALDENGQVLKNVKYTDADILSLKNLNKNIVLVENQQKALAITKVVDQWMKDRATAGFDQNFYVENNKVYIKENNSKAADELVFEKLQAVLKVFQ